MSTTHRRTIDDDSAGAADAVLATDMGSGEPQHVTQAIRQRHARLDLDFDFSAVDLELHGHRGFHRARAARKARSTMVPVSARR